MRRAGGAPLALLARARAPRAARAAPPLAAAAPPRPDPIYTIPNALTALRFVLAPVVGARILAGDFDGALALFSAAAALDVADGAIARRWPSQASKIGSYLDPVADKALVAAAALPLAAAGALPPALVALWLGRDAALVGGGFALRAAARPRGVAFFDSTHAATPALAPTALSKANTLAQVGLVVWALAAQSALGAAAGGPLPPAEGAAWAVAAAAAAATTVGSAAGYAREGARQWRATQAARGAA
jgi:phosphatidylglycerophosphate synthase